MINYPERSLPRSNRPECSCSGSNRPERSRRMIHWLLIELRLRSAQVKRPCSARVNRLRSTQVN